MNNCLFCRIAKGEIPAEIVHEDESVLAFRDVNPQAPTHVLVIPREHVARLSEAEPGHETMLGGLLRRAAILAAELGLRDGFRVVVNDGRAGGQTVHHLHVHLLGGRSMTWPPG